MAAILCQKSEHANATVTLCHSRSADIGEHCRRADILIAAMGVPEFVKADMVKPGAVVIDVGVNRIPDPEAKNGSRLVGDVDFAEVQAIAGRITPNPGGVGPMTIAMLLRNTVRAAARANGLNLETLNLNPCQIPVFSPISSAPCSVRKSVRKPTATPCSSACSRS